MGNLVISKPESSILVHNPTRQTLDRTISRPVTVVRFVIWLFDEHQTRNADEHSSSDSGCSVSVCQISGARTLVDDARVGLARHGVIAAVQRHDTAAIFDWLIDALSYQGVSDTIAWVTWSSMVGCGARDIASTLTVRPSCPKLHCYWSFCEVQ